MYGSGARCWIMCLQVTAFLASTSAENKELFREVRLPSTLPFILHPYMLRRAVLAGGASCLRAAESMGPYPKGAYQQPLSLVRAPR